jgi:hypothetical protein
MAMHDAQRLLLVVGGYLAAFVLATNLAWILRTPCSGRLGRAVEFIRLWGGKLHLNDLVRMTYYLLPPYLVLYWGWASPLDLGLADLDWIRGTGQAVALALGGWVVLALVWWQYVRLLRPQPAMPQEQRLGQPWGWTFLLREAILLESGWALVRSPMLLLAGPYFGAYLALAAVCAAALLNARTRHELGVSGVREEVLLTGSIAVWTATLYVYVHNLWLCIAAHLFLKASILALVRWGMGRTSATSAPGPAQSAGQTSP